MTSHTPTSTDQARSLGVAGRVRIALTALSDRLHAAGDARAHASGWAVTTVAGPLGLNGRAYRHPGFDARPGPRTGRQDAADA